MVSDTTLYDTYQILLVDADGAHAQNLIDFLQTQGHTSFHVSSACDLGDQVARQNPDILVIVVNTPDAYLIQQIQKLSLPVVVFSEDGRREKIREAIQAGVASYVVSGFAPHRVMPIVEAAISRFREMQTLKQALVTTKTDLAERKLIDRAKGMIMDQRKCREDEAYRILRRMAMDRKKKLGDVARDVLDIGKVFL